MQWGFNYMQDTYPNGGSVYLRLSTRPIAQPVRQMTPALRDGILKGQSVSGSMPPLALFNRQNHGGFYFGGSFKFMHSEYSISLICMPPLSDDDHLSI